MPPEGLGDPLDEGVDAGGADAGEGVRGAGEEEVEEAKAEGVALFIEAVGGLASTLPIALRCKTWQRRKTIS